MSEKSKETTRVTFRSAVEVRTADEIDAAMREKYQNPQASLHSSGATRHTCSDKSQSPYK